MLKKTLHNRTRALFTTSILSLAVFCTAHTADASPIDDLKDKINERGSIIQKLNEEINKYQEEITKTSQQAQTLQSTVNVLNTTQKKLGTDLKVTENQIDRTDITIQKTETEIEQKERLIQQNKQALGAAIKQMDTLDGLSLIETLLTYNDLGSFWTQVETLLQFQKSIRENSDKLRQHKIELEEHVNENEQEKTKLLGYKEQLADKKKVVEQNKSEKAKLLAETHNQEAEYKMLLADRVAKKLAFEKELLEFESQLKREIDPKSIPTSGKGVLAWPLAKVTITQQFGDTEFSRQNAGAYNGHGHNGIDLAAPIGTALMSAADGVVSGSGDTDAVCSKASYGKWVLIKHNNGLSTLYAHLSVIKATAGQAVSRGDIIGYSGNTGYSTGPHLHFTVYASQGVEIMQRQSAVCGGAYTMPIADLKAYLNPLLYL